MLREKGIFRILSPPVSNTPYSTTLNNYFQVLFAKIGMALLGNSVKLEEIFSQKYLRKMKALSKLPIFS